LGADVTVRATAGGAALLTLGGAREALRVSGEDAPRAALLAAEVFLEISRASGSGAWRVDELPVPVAELTAAVERALAGAGVGCARSEERRVGEGGGTRGEAGS